MVFSENGQTGLIDFENNTILDASFDNIKPFNDNGYAIVQKEQKCGVINALGDVLIECVWDDIDLFSTVNCARCWDYAILDFGCSMLIDLNTLEPITPNGSEYEVFGDLIYNYVRYPSNGQNPYTEIYNKNGQLLMAQEGYCCLPFTQGYAAFQATDGHTTVSDLSGSIVFSLESGWIDFINNGEIYYTKTNLISDTDSSFIRIGGVADNNGTKFEIMEYSIAAPLSDSLYLIVKDRNDIDYEVDERRIYGYADVTGRICNVSQYDYATPYYHGSAAVCIDDNWHFIDKDGQPVGDIVWCYNNHQFSMYTMPIEKGWNIIPVGENGNIHLINRQGEVVSDEIFDEWEFINTGETDNEQYVYLRDCEGRLCLLGGDGVIARINAQYFIAPYTEWNIWWVSIDGKWGALDISNSDNSKQGVWIVNPQFDWILDEGGYLYAQMNDINKTNVYMTIDGIILGPANER